MIPHIAQLKFTHHADLVDPAPAQTIVEKGPVEILIFGLLRIYARIKRNFLQGIGNSACFDYCWDTWSRRCDKRGISTSACS